MFQPALEVLPTAVHTVILTKKSGHILGAELLCVFISNSQILVPS